MSFVHSKVILHNTTSWLHNRKHMLAVQVQLCFLTGKTFPKTDKYSEGQQIETVRELVHHKALGKY